MRKTLLILFVVVFIQCQEDRRDYSFMNPETWERLDIAKIEVPFGHGIKESIEYDNGIVVSATSNVSAEAGLQVLKNGGNAMDAALTTALTSIALNGGAAVSYAGFINVMYYDNETGKTHTMNGGFNTVKAETDPLTIDYDKPGRTILVPGFMKGVESAHEKFGSFPFETLFVPAIHFSENGIPFPVHLKAILEESKGIFTAEDTKNIFKSENGEWIKQGELFKQPQLAETLKNIAEHGADYMYNGNWAKNFVKLVRDQGGQITLEDLSNYDVLWSTPLTTEYNGYEVNAMPMPNTGGINTIEALNILSNLDFNSSQPYDESAESFFKLTRTSNVAHLMGTGINYISTDSIQRQMTFPDMKFDYSSRITQTNAKAIANLILSKEWEENMTRKIENKGTHGGHSDAVIVVDENGNVATILFTINTNGWGRNGIFVDGISIPDAAVYQKHHLVNIKPGERIPEATTPIIVMQNGKPFLVSNAIANGVHEVTLKNLIGILNYDLNPFEAVSKPDFGPPKYMLDLEETEVKENEKQYVVFGNTVREGSFEISLLDSLNQLGQPIYKIDRNNYGNYSGLWIGAKIDPIEISLEGTTPNPNFGGVKGY